MDQVQVVLAGMAGFHKVQVGRKSTPGLSPREFIWSQQGIKSLEREKAWLRLASTRSAR